MILNNPIGRRLLSALLFTFLLLSPSAAGHGLAADAAVLEETAAPQPLSEGTFFDGEAAAPLPSAGLPVLPNYNRDSLPLSLSRGILPARYDSRSKGYVTSVKDQASWGACWAFGALAAGESSMLKKGIAGSTIDLSEMHLAYFFFQCPQDPLWLTAGDTVRNNTGEHYLNTGGNNLFTMFALSKWLGPISESLMPYGNTSAISQAYAYRDTAHLQNARFVNSADSASVKNLIMEYGAVSTALYYHPSFQNTNGAYFFPYPGNGTNHIVSIVGWDDTYSRSHFSVTYSGQTVRPSSDGAWIVKNSYGTSLGDGGYIYISYEDASFTQINGDYLSYAFDMEKADNYDHNYQYDGSFGAEIVTSMNDTSLANVYKVRGNPGSNERLDAVSFSLFSQNVRYSIQIYKNPSAGKPDSGSPVLSSPQTGTTTYSGYYTIPLNEKIVFTQGDTFSVVITLHSLGESSVKYFVDQTGEASGLQFLSSSSANQSFYASEASDGWIDFHSLGYGKTARIKAFTTDTSEPPTEVEVITGTLKRPVITYLKRSGSGKVKLKWRSVKNTEKYELYRSLKKNSGYKRIAVTSKTTYSDTKRQPGATYYYKVRARRTLNGAPAYSKYSLVKNVKLSLSAPTLSTVKVSGKKVTLKWKKITGAKGYQVFRSSRKNRGFRTLKTCQKASCSYKLKKKKVYYYKVRAYTVIGGKKVYSKFSTVKKK